MYRVRTFAPLLIAALLLSLAPAAMAQAPTEEALMDIVPAWANAYNAGDLDALAALYTEAAVVMPPNGERVRGHDALKALAASYIEAGAVQIELPPPDAYDVLGETAWIEGTYRFFAPDGSPVDIGKYLDVYTFEDGAWRIQHHMWNSDLPPMASQQARRVVRRAVLERFERAGHRARVDDAAERMIERWGDALNGRAVELSDDEAFELVMEASQGRLDVAEIARRLG